MPLLTYWEAKGETFKKINELLNRREELMKPLVEFCIKQGGVLLYSDGGTHLRTGLGIENKKLENGITELKEPKHPEHWKRVKGHDEAWVPRLSTKEGKTLMEEMDALTRPIPTRMSVGDVIGLAWIGLEGLYQTTPQAYRVQSGKRILLVIPTEKYKPKKGVSLVRISDLLFNKLVGKSVLKKDAIL